MNLRGTHLFSVVFGVTLLGVFVQRLDFHAILVHEVVCGRLELDREVLREDGEVVHARRVNLVHGLERVRVEGQLVAGGLGLGHDLSRHLARARVLRPKKEKKRRTGEEDGCRSQFYG